mgnify:CR=1 FL=1
MRTICNLTSRSAQNGQLQRFMLNKGELYLSHLSRSAAISEVAGLQKQTASCPMPYGILTPNRGLLPVLGCCPCLFL